MNYGNDVKTRLKYNMLKKYLNILIVKPRAKGIAMFSLQMSPPKMGAISHFFTLLRKSYRILLPNEHVIIIN